MDDDFSANADLESNTDEHSQADSASLAVVRNEIKMMNVVRTIVFALVLAVTFIAADVTYIVARIYQEDNFAYKFEAFSLELVAGFYESLQHKMETAETLSTSLMMMQVKDQENPQNSVSSQWPYASFTEFDTRCAGARKLSKASTITFAPLLAPPLVSMWVNYATYTDSQATLAVAENHVDTFEPHAGHVHHEGDQESVFYHETNRSLVNGIYTLYEGNASNLQLPASLTDSNEFYFPIWQQAPTSAKDARMYDLMSNAVRSQALSALMASNGKDKNTTGVLTDFLIHDTNMTDYAYYATPRTSLYYPIFDNVDHEHVVAALDFEFMWETFLEGIIVDDDETPGPMVVVVESTCTARNDDFVPESEFSFWVEGVTASFLGVGDHSTDPKDFSAPPPTLSSYDHYRDVLNLPYDPSANNPCTFRLRIYATPEFKDIYVTKFPDHCKWIVLALLLAVTLVFITYDCVVEAKSNAVVQSAKETDALVSTLFPSSVKARLLEQAKQKKKQTEQKKRLVNWQTTSEDLSVDGSTDLSIGKNMIHTPKKRLKSFLVPGGGGMDSMIAAGDIDDSEPIADLFPNASVMFADVAGFTAWSSERDPSQVFKLLETLYRSMDKAARRFRVFKVETIGDCYVAATGLPDPREDHVEAICRFARTSLLRTNHLTRALEATLGPGTAELALRFGIHSGPVTAGVLRGEKARFQLFGDTMNFAARMETTGLKNKIHLSTASAKLLIARGHSHWVQEREEAVYAKGKGTVQTFWLMLGASSASHSGTASSGESVASSEFSADGDNQDTPNGRHATVPKSLPSSGGSHDNVLVGVIGESKLKRSIDRLVEWNTGSLAGLLKKVVASRAEPLKPLGEEIPAPQKPASSSRSFMDQMKLVIPLPEFNEDAVARSHEAANIELPRRVNSELRMYISAIASGYRKNHFHNFEHARYETNIFELCCKVLESHLET